MDGDVEQLRLRPLGGIQIAHRVGRRLVGGGVAQGDPGDGPQSGEAGPLVLVKGRVPVAGEDEQAGDLPPCRMGTLAVWRTRLSASRNSGEARIVSMAPPVTTVRRVSTSRTSGCSDSHGESNRRPIQVTPSRPPTEGLDGELSVLPALEGRAVGAHQPRSLVEDRVDHRPWIQ